MQPTKAIEAELSLFQARACCIPATTSKRFTYSDHRKATNEANSASHVGLLNYGPGRPHNLERVRIGK